MSIAQTLIPDVLELIAEQLEKGRGTTHPDALSFALVCKGWHAAGIKELYRDLEGTLAGAEKAISARPELAQHVRRLTVLLDPQYKADLRLVGSLPRLRVIEARGRSTPNFDLFKKLGSSPSIPVLRALCLQAYNGTAQLDVADLFALLERATCLRTFSLFALPGHLKSTSAAPSRPFRLHHLSLHYPHSAEEDDETRFSSATAGQVQTLLFTAFDFSSLRSFSTYIDQGESILYSRLAAATNLRTLKLCNDNLAVAPSLAGISRLLPSLPTLRSFELTVLHYDHFILSGSRATSNAELESLLAAFAPTLRHLSLSIVFVGGASHPALSGFLKIRRAGPLQKVEVYHPAENGRTGRLLLRKVRTTGGEGDENDPTAWQWLEPSICVAAGSDAGAQASTAMGLETVPQ
ncbi:hypothetical protein JCM6882_009018 [Rhodosporidiobolus microsporus]